jgi:hypothetical protein
MDSFYLIVLGVATFVLIMMLAFLGWTMSKTKKGTRYPSIVKTCPDNWTVDSKTVAGQVYCVRPDPGESNYGKITASGATKENDLTTYMATTGSPGFVTGQPTFLNPKDIKWTPCNKKEWAQKYEIKWDSINSANYCGK